MRDTSPQQPVERNGIPERTPEQAADEAAFRQVREIIVNVEQAIRRAERAHKELTRTGTHPGYVTVSEDAITELKSLRKRLTQRTYFPAEDPRAPASTQQAMFEDPADPSGDQQPLFGEPADAEGQTAERPGGEGR